MSACLLLSKHDMHTSVQQRKCHQDEQAKINNVDS